MLWAKWSHGEVKYSPRIYGQIAKFNATALGSGIVKRIFGKYPDGRRLPYEEILKGCPDIDIFNKGTIIVGGNRHNICRRYRLRRETLELIFSDEKLLRNVLDAKSDFYTKRQRRLIFAIMGADEAVQENDTTITSENSEKTEKSEIEMTQETTDAPAHPEDDLPAEAEPVQRMQRTSGRPSDDIPATSPGKSKLCPILQKCVDAYVISAREASRISEIAYRFKTTYKEAPGGFCAQYAYAKAGLRAQIALTALKENPFLMEEEDAKTLKFVSDLRFMIKDWKRRGAEMKASKTS